MTYDTIRHDARDQLDAEYEASTQGADAWRDRLAQRHRFGRVLDKLPFHVSRPPYARAYIRPKTWLNKIVFWFRGWHPFGAWGIWHKPNRRQRLLDRPPDDDDGALTVWLYFAVVVVALVVIWLVMS